jgi:hypothetical protein
VILHEEDGKITIERPATPEDLDDWYRRYAAASEALEQGMAGVSREADQYLDDALDW